MAAGPASGRGGGSRSRRSGPGILLAAALASACGCSFIAVRRPPSTPVPPDAPLPCTPSRVSPVLDTIGAVAVPIFGLTLWGLCKYGNAMQSWASSPNYLQCGPVLWGTLAATGLYVGSAVHGFDATGACLRLAEQRAAVGPVPSKAPPAP